MGLRAPGPVFFLLNADTYVYLRTQTHTKMCPCGKRISALHLRFTWPVSHVHIPLLSIQGQVLAQKPSGADPALSEVQAPPPPPRILRFPWQLVREQVRQTVAEALQVWSEVTPLTFTEVHDGHADIMIDFTR